MKIAVIAAGGRSGALITGEAVKRGHEVTAFIRAMRDTPARHVVVKDARDVEAEDLTGFDAVVNAFGVWEPDQLVQHDEVTQKLADALSGTDTKLYVVGSAGSLLVGEERDQRLWESELMPEPFKPLASAMAEAFDNLRARDDVDWVYVSPPLDFQADGEKKGTYIVAGDGFTTNNDGGSSMSYADFAVALMDIIEKGEFTQQRISLLSS